MSDRLATAGPDWEPPVSLDISADELNAVFVGSRRGIKEVLEGLEVLRPAA